MTPDVPGLVTLAVPCRTDEPALARTVEAALESWRWSGRAVGGRLEVLVCLNGPPAPEPLAALRSLAARVAAPLLETEVDGGPPAPPPVAAAGVTMAALVTRRVGKPVAWNVLRAAARSALAVFVDADVSFTADAMGLLLDALDAHPGAALASGKTTCAPRPGLFEAVMAAPYGVDFPNLSAQLYGARLAELPRAMPEDLIEPERWLELTLGRERVVRVPAARVAVRLPATLRDFFRQRVRIEMGKVQLDRDYAGLAARGEPQPGSRVALSSLGPRGTARLAAYLALRSLAHAIAWQRYRRGRTAGVWRQAATTKQWDSA